jgi:hypothetical protein
VLRPRRHFLAATGALAAGAVLPGCGDGMGARQYATAVRETWRHTRPMPTETAPLYRELVRYATLAPSSHNTQCWTFALEGGLITIKPDFTRRCPVVDPDDHHLYVSLGCAAENLLLAARAQGLHGELQFEPVAGAVRVVLSPAPPADSPLFQAIPRRQTTRSEYDGRPVGAATLKRLEEAGRGEGVAVELITAKDRMEGVLDFVLRGNSAQMDDPAFVRELKSWIRFNAEQAVVSGDGLYTLASGNPELPGWLADPLFDLFFRKDAENDKYAAQVRSASGLAVFHSEGDGPARWVEVGRCYQRFALRATTEGLTTAFVNQPVEVAALRPEFARALGLGERRPDLVVRYGHAPAMPRSLRRSIGEVVLKGPCM